MRSVSADAYRMPASSARRASSLAKLHGCLSTRYPLARPTIFLEVHLNYLEQRGISAHDVTGPIAACGYGFTDLSGRRRSERSIAKSWASVLHVIGHPTAVPVPV